MEYTTCVIPQSEYSLFNYNSFTNIFQLFELDFNLVDLSEQDITNNLAKYKNTLKVRLNIYAESGCERKLRKILEEQ